ncbi:hypothetical protein RV02_GL001341 [Enterococcus gilvus]|nr:hypothetical protein RV02_GL001341 [Enterococcus gilvus]
MRHYQSSSMGKLRKKKTLRLKKPNKRHPQPINSVAGVV